MRTSVWGCTTWVDTDTDTAAAVLVQRADLLYVGQRGVGVVQPERRQFGRRVQQTEQPLGVGDAAVTAPRAPRPPTTVEGVTGDRLPDVQQVPARIDLHFMPPHRSPFAIISRATHRK